MKKVSFECFGTKITHNFALPRKELRWIFIATDQAQKIDGIQGLFNFFLRLMELRNFRIFDTPYFTFDDLMFALETRR